MSCFYLESLIKAPTCFQSINLSCTELFLTNKKNFFKNPNVLKVGISDHHNFVLTALKTQFIKGSPKVKCYRSYKIFDIETSKTELSTVLTVSKTEDYSSFEEAFTSVLHNYVPIKKKF